MSPPAYHRVTAADGVVLRGAVFAAENPTGVVTFFNGQGEYIEKYLEIYAELNQRGLTLATFDWRGQGGSQRALADPRIGHVGDFAEYELDARAFLDQVVRPLTHAPVCALGHSMGGHMLLRCIHTMPERFSRAVLNAPMLKFRTHGLYRPLALAAIRVHGLLGLGTRFARGMKRRDPATEPFERQRATSDRVRHARGQSVLQAHPDLRIFGPSWGWLDAANRSIATVRQAGYAESIKTPILVIGAGCDRVCFTEAARDYARRLAKAAYVEIAGAEHEILRERDPIRDRFWQAFDGFRGTPLPS